MNQHITKGSVLDDLGLNQFEAHNLKMRAALMRALEKYVETQGWTQAHTASILNITQPRVSDIRRGKIERFTLDMLITLLEKCGVHVSLVIEDKWVA